jgi:hypoxanthine phosphoribosyltransferase
MSKNLFEHILTIFYQIYRKYIFLKKEDLNKMINIIINKIKDSGYNPEIVIAILEEGIIPAELISQRLGLKLATIGFASYSLKLFGIEVEHFPIIKRIAKPFGYRREVKMTKKLNGNIKNKKVLVVDNDSVKGKTINLALATLQKYNPKEIKTAVLCKYHVLDIIDFCAVDVSKKKGLEKRHRIAPWVEISPYYSSIK